ncbi:MAG: HDOD domain-containing protein [Anaeromyxobacter sp.]
MTSPAHRMNQDLTDSLRYALASPTYRPPMLPGVALEVMQLSRSTDEVELADVVNLLERDPVLAARVLGIAQSAAYTRRGSVTSLLQAAVRLGLETLSQVVVQAALELKLFRAPGYEKFAVRLNHHATATAHVTRDVCKRAGLPAEQGFMCGLLHDIGFAASLTVAIELGVELGVTDFEDLAPSLDVVHAEVSGLLARRWKLPEPIVQVVSTHHHADVNGEPRPMNAAVILAEQFCWEAGAGMLPPPEKVDLGAPGCPPQPMDGLDASWPNVIRQALEVLKLDAAGVKAARAAAFERVAEVLPGAKP